MIAELALLWAALVLVPIALPLCSARGWIALPPAVALAVSYALPIGPVAAAFAAPWALTTAGLAVASLRSPRLETLALGCLAVGGLFALLSRAGVLLGFPSIIILLTAVHYTYAGFILPLVARPLSRVATLLALIAMPLVAIGITFSPLLEWLAAWLLAAVAFAVAILQLRASGPGQVLRVVSSLSFIAAMALAGTYALSEFSDRNWIDIRLMLPTHGALNVLGFATCGLAARCLKGG